MFRYDRLDELVAKTGKKKNYLSMKMGHAGRYLNDAKKQNINIKNHDVSILAKELDTSIAYLRGETDDPTPENKKIPTQTCEEKDIDLEWFISNLPKALDLMSVEDLSKLLVITADRMKEKVKNETES